uniref:Uncharacterized protein n=1 Tax=Oryza glumipatula TaxID=40148 RepID=A0A0E0ACU2_9ORYZ
MTHIHTTARTRGLLPAVLFPLSLSLSLSRGAACLRLSSPPPRLGLLLSSPNLSLARRINIALASPPLSRLASERTNGRASGERGEPEAGGLCASVSLLPSSPPSPFSALLSIPAVQEMRELEKLRTETMMKSCQSTTSRAGAIRCPVPRKSGRSYKEYDLTQDLSDFIMSKASPPYFTGSPPVRASNPLVHDTQFCAWKLQNIDQSLSIPIPTKGCNVY